MSQNVKSLGRSDCIPSANATPKQQYLASKVEITPDQNGNGPKTAKYFQDNFNLKPKEALALMGAHTIGRYSGFQTHIDYAWVRKLWPNQIIGQFLLVPFVNGYLEKII